MENAKLLISSHAPFWHNGSNVTNVTRGNDTLRNYPVNARIGAEGGPVQNIRKNITSDNSGQIRRNLLRFLVHRFSLCSCQLLHRCYQYNGKSLCTIHWLWRRADLHFL